MSEAAYPCIKCGKLRTKAEGGTVFTVCYDCWDKTAAASGGYLDKPIEAASEYLYEKKIEELKAKLIAAEAEIERLRVALEKIGGTSHGVYCDHDSAEAAKKALAPTECQHVSYMSERGLPYCEKCGARMVTSKERGGEE